MGAPAQSPPLAAVTQFGKYLLDAEIARGGMARVYLARLRGLGGFEKRLVVKQVLPELARDPKFVELFVAEAKALVGMSHPHIVPVYELGVVDGVYFLAMEHVEGATLSEMLLAGPIPPGPVAQVAVQICDALDYAHTRFGVVHRDVTPRNVIVDATGNARLLDFGIAARVDAEDAGAFGSPGFIAPEQLMTGRVGPRGDLFALGAVLFECLTGAPAFLRKTDEETRRALLEDPLPSLADASGVPPGLAAIITDLLARDPEGRPDSAGAAGRRFRSWLASAFPEGVERDLGSRAERAFEVAQAKRSLRPIADAEHRRDSSRQVRTLATSPILQAMLDGAERAATHDVGRESDNPQERTVPLGRAQRKPVSTTAAGERHRAPRIIVITAVVTAVLALGYSALVPDSGPPVSRPDSTVTRPPSAVTRLRGAPETASPPRVAPGRAPLQVPVGPDAARLANAIAGDAGARAAPAVVRASAIPTGDTGVEASLRINATPWANVALDGRPLAGTTPFRRLAIRPGSHIVTLDCPPLGRSARVSFRATPGQELSIMVDMTRDPPAATVR